MDWSQPFSSVLEPVKVVVRIAMLLVEEEIVAILEIALS